MDPAPTAPAANEDDAREARRWLAEIRRYDREFESWKTRSEKIVKRYRDQRADDNQAEIGSPPKYNVLWSIVQTITPALYAKTPKPEVIRRFMDKDPLGLLAGQILERATTYTVSTGGFDPLMGNVVADYLLPGRGTSWVRYVPTFGAPVSVNDSGGSDDDAGDDGDDDEAAEEAPPEVVAEEAAVDYVHWKDFGHSPARTWAEVWSVWRWVYMDRADLRKRFAGPMAERGLSVDDIPMTYSPPGVDDKAKDGSADQFKRAMIAEIWDRRSRKVYWVAKDWDKGCLDCVDDPLRLRGFFPCPPPIYATTTTDSLVPVPDYLEYQDQARQLDDLTARISLLAEALAVRGVYDAKIDELGRLLTEQTENKMIPVDNWASFAQAGGLKGAVDFMPLEMVIQTMQGLMTVRAQVLQDIDQITGISDIVRGEGEAGETATAQRIKGQFAGARLGNRQRDVQRFARDTIALVAEVIAEHFAPETIMAIAHVEGANTNQQRDAARAQIQSAMQQAQAASIQSAQVAMQTGQPPQTVPAPQIPPEIQKAANDPTIEDAIQLLRDDAMRTFRVDIETDSTLAADQGQEKQDRMEFLTAAGGFLAQMAPIGQSAPAMLPLIGELLKFGVRGFPVARGIEEAIDTAIDKAMEQATAAPPPDPKAAEVQGNLKARQQEVQGQLAIRAHQVQGELAIKAAEAHHGAMLDAAGAAHDAGMAEQQAAQQAAQPQGAPA